MINVEWDVPMTIESPQGDLDLNEMMALAAGDGMFALDKTKCAGAFNLRSSERPVPQADGWILGKRFKTGAFVNLGVAYAADGDKAACAELLVEMDDLLGLHLNALMNADTGRLLWTPSGYTDGNRRLLDNARLAVAPAQFFEEPFTGVTFGVASPFPYAIDLTQFVTSITDGGSVTITNGGNTEFWPVFKVYGATSLFVLSNNTSGEQLVYDASRPGASAIGGGDYIEFDFFRNTAYLNGNSSNRKAGIDVETSDFFSLASGANDIAISGADCVCLSNAAWA